MTRNIAVGFLLFLIVYAGFAFLTPLMAVNKSDEDPAEEIAIFIKTNGVHTDIVVPITNDIIDWRELCDPKHSGSMMNAAEYVAIGWGDKGFYLNTPEWSDLKFSTAFNAAFYLGTSAMHTTFYNQVAEDDNCIKIWISRAEYRLLAEFIRTSFATDSQGNTILIGGSYGNTDSFYDAQGRYNLFYTCNSWANNALKAARQKAALWSLTDSGIFRHYR